MKKEYTTLSVDKELRPKLEKVMISLGRKMTYNEIIHFLVDGHLEEEEFVKHMIDKDMLD